MAPVFLGCTLTTGSHPPAESNDSPQLIYEMGHTDLVQTADFAQGGSVLVTVGASEAIEWDMASGKELRTLKGHTNNVRAVAVHGNDVATGSTDGTIKIWNLTTGALRHNVRLRPRGEEGSSRSVSALAFTSDFKTLLALDQDYDSDAARKQFITRYDGSNFKPTGRTKLPPAYIDFGVFSRNGALLAMKVEDTILSVYETATGTERLHLKPDNWEKGDNSFHGRHIVISPDGSRLATLSSKNGILVYRTADGELISTIPPKQIPGDVDAAVFSADGLGLVISTNVETSEFGTISRPPPVTINYAQRLVRVRVDTETAIILPSVDVGQRDYIYTNGCCNVTNLRDSGVGNNVYYMALAGSDDVLLLTMTDGNAYLVDPATGAIKVHFASNVSYVEDLAASSDGAWLSTAVTSGAAFWSTRTGRVEERAGPLNLHSLRGSQIFEGPFLQMHFPDPNIVSIADSGEFDDVDLDARTVTHTSRVSALGYLVARSSRHAGQSDDGVGLIDSGKDQEIRPHVFARDMIVGTGPSYTDMPRHALIEDQSALIGQIMIAPVPTLFSGDASTVFFVHDQTPCKLIVDSLEKACFGSLNHERNIHDMKLDEASGQLFVAADRLGDSGLGETWSIKSGAKTAEMRLDTPFLSIAPGEAGQVVFMGDLHGRLSKWRVQNCSPKYAGILPCSPLWVSDLKSERIDAVAVSADDKYVLSGGTTGLVTVTRAIDGSPVLTLATVGSHWFVSAPDGRFDTDDLEDTPGLHWSVPDDPFHPLSPNAFFRDYFQPGLLAQVLSGAPAPVENTGAGKLQDLNRASPGIGAPLVSAEHPDGTFDVSVELSPGSYAEQGGSGPHQVDVTQAFDLRLFRDGQLVDTVPHARSMTPDGVSSEDKVQWRLDMQAVARNDARVVEHGNTATVTFTGVRMPTGTGDRPVNLTAYAFNSDRVRSTPVSTSIQRRERHGTPRAYLVSIGINDYGGVGWDLHYAVKDARQVSTFLPAALQKGGFEIVQERLIADTADLKPVEVQADKQHIMQAIRRIAGLATPDDVVVIFFSGHAYGGSKTGFNLLMSDQQPWRANWSSPAPEDLAKTISAAELLQALGDISAAEIALIVDACHGAAAIANGAWRPGPLGGHTFGQLAYDKSMEVLAASQTEDKALELGDSIAEGVLTYALIHDGLRAGKGVDYDGRINLRSLMKYTVTRVPGLLKDIEAGRLDDFGVPIEKDSVSRSEKGPGNDDGDRQLPEFFDFSRGRPSVSLQ
jgi:WD40 repeat protein